MAIGITSTRNGCGIGVLNDDVLAEEVRKLAGINQRLPVLLLLAHLPQPAKTLEVTTKGVDVGFRKLREWNVTDILRKAADRNEVAQLNDGWRLLEPGRNAIASAGVELGPKRPPPPTDSVVPRELFSGTRKYIERVVDQINASYDHGLWDCCAVMCRRLGETLIIEVYEHEGRAHEIKGPDGNFQMLNGLLSVLSNDNRINLGRNSKKGLRDLKELGDKAAHDRRFNARQPDIDVIKSGLRSAAEDLLHLAGLAK